LKELRKWSILMGEKNKKKTNKESGKKVQNQRKKEGEETRKKGTNRGGLEFHVKKKKTPGGAQTGCGALGG